MSQKENMTDIDVLDKVAIIGTHFSNGAIIPNWCKKHNYTVVKITNDKALLAEIVSWVDLKDLKIYQN